MHVISAKKLRKFWGDHPDSRPPLRAWLKIAERAAWQSFAELRESFAHADVFGQCVIFNIGGNKYRLLVAIHYNRSKVFVRHVLTHRDYDKGAWKDECRS